MVVVKGEINMVVATLGGLVLWTTGVNVLRVVRVLVVVLVVVVVVLLVAGTGCGVADCVVLGETLTEGMVVIGFFVLVAEATVVVVGGKESVGVSCGWGRGDT